MTKPLCNGHKRNGEPCAKVAGYGTDHLGFGNCKYHAGSTPAGERHAAKLQATQAVATYGLAREIDPHSALLEELHRTAGHVAWLGQLIADLETSSELKQYQHMEAGGVVERPAIWVELYARERKHFAAVAKTCVDVGIEERRVRVIESMGAEIADFGRRLVARLGHDPADPAVREAFRAELTVIDGGRAA